MPSGCVLVAERNHFIDPSSLLLILVVELASRAITRNAVHIPVKLQRCYRGVALPVDLSKRRDEAVGMILVLFQDASIPCFFSSGWLPGLPHAAC